jgi:hypothetical protein
LESFSYELQFDMHFYMHSYLHKKNYSCKKWVLHAATRRTCSCQQVGMIRERGTRERGTVAGMRHGRERNAGYERLVIG